MYDDDILILIIIGILYTPLWAPPIILSPRKCRNLLPGQGVYLGPATPSKQEDDDNDNNDDHNDDDNDNNTMTITMMITITMMTTEISVTTMRNQDS